MSSYPRIGQNNYGAGTSLTDDRLYTTDSPRSKFRVVIAESFRVPPPVPGPPAPPAGQAPPPPETIDVEYERQLITDLENGSPLPLSSDSITEKIDDLVKNSPGFTREEIIFAHSIALSQNPSNTEELTPELVLRIAKSYKGLTEMGFSSLHVLGALALHNNDAEAALDCLAEMK